MELYGMDVTSAYQNAFVYIRQLALLLRKSLQSKTKDSFQAVRRWQVMAVSPAPDAFVYLRPCSVFLILLYSWTYNRRRITRSSLCLRAVYAFCCWSRW